MLGETRLTEADKKMISEKVFYWLDRIESKIDQKKADLEVWQDSLVNLDDTSNESRANWYYKIIENCKVLLAMSVVIFISCAHASTLHKIGNDEVSWDHAPVTVMHSDDIPLKETCDYINKEVGMNILACYTATEWIKNNMANPDVVAVLDPIIVATACPLEDFTRCRGICSFSSVLAGGVLHKVGIYFRDTNDPVVFTHELLHALGVRHSKNVNDVMYYAATNLYIGKPTKLVLKETYGKLIDMGY